MLCIAMLPLAFAAYVQVSELVIHHQMREELEQKNLVTIRLKSSQIIWTEKGKEASVNGFMFDIERYAVNGNEIELTGLFDKDEDALFAQVDNAQQKNNNDATGGVLILKWFGCFSWNTNHISDNILTAQAIYNKPIQQNSCLQNPVLSCETPPPKPIII